eukprot:1987435-Pyramimonas_sp.AAC.1
MSFWCAAEKSGAAAGPAASGEPRALWRAAARGPRSCGPREPVQRGGVGGGGGSPLPFWLEPLWVKPPFSLEKCFGGPHPQ